MVENKASTNGKPVLTKGKVNDGKKDEKAVIAKSAEMAPLEQVPAKQDTKAEAKVVCCVCGSDKTAKRMSGKPRWHPVDEKETLCHGCWIKSRDDDEQKQETS